MDTGVKKVLWQKSKIRIQVPDSSESKEAQVMKCITKIKIMNETIHLLISLQNLCLKQQQL